MVWWLRDRPTCNVLCPWSLAEPNRVFGEQDEDILERAAGEWETELSDGWKGQPMLMGKDDTDLR
jgi:hypothetical protein